MRNLKSVVALVNAYGLKYSFLFRSLVLVSSMFALCSCTLFVKPIASFVNVSVPEEGGVNFLEMTSDADNVANPGVKRNNILSGTNKVALEWWINPMIAVSPDGSKIAYINAKNGMQNVMIKSARSGGASIQRTFRNFVTDFSWSPDGKSLCFTEYRNGNLGVYLVSSEQGSIVKQISTGVANDYAGVMTADGNIVFFHRGEGGLDSYGLWSYDMKTNLYSNYSRGMAPCLIPGKTNEVYCSRYTTHKECEVWRVNFDTGIEEVILSQPNKSFTTPRLSPDGRWILCTGSSVTPRKIQNTDIFVIRTDGTMFTQLTYHPGNDISAAWAPDGKSIYFLSQRGSKEGKYNVWKMDFNL